jgi:anhydro-N-acetylmuramic acid kinase
MHLLEKLSQKPERLVIGLNSGTSMDSMDVALVRIEGSGLSAKPHLQMYNHFLFPDGLKDHVLSCVDKGSLQDISQFHVLLGRIFANTVNQFLELLGIKAGEIDLIGSHGQTVFHHPNSDRLFRYNIHSTLQIGDPSVIAQETGILTVGDFRSADVAAGGSGAPLTPYLDYIVFRSDSKNRGVLNIGGVANFSVLNKNENLDDIVAFDTGPGNLMIDYIVQKFFALPYDKDGEVARASQVCDELLEELMHHPYLFQSLPKTTGREIFGQHYSQHLIAHYPRVSPEEFIATFTEFTAQSIFDQYTRFVQPESRWDELIVSGGGARNQFLMERLKFHFKNVDVKSSSDYNIPTDAKEAILFALLANEAICGNAANIPHVTGAKKKAVLGKICLP